MIKISVNGLAQFMKARHSRQRTILRSYKFKTDKNGKKRPQIVRYSEARSAVVKFHQSDNDISILEAEIADLYEKETMNPDKDASRIRDNIRAIKTYSAHFKDKKYTVLPTPKPKYTRGDVEVSAAPELFVEEDGKRKMIKLDFNAAKPDDECVEVILKVMHEASVEANLSVSPKNVIYLDVSRQNTFSGARMNKRLKQDIDAACDTIADIWPKIKQS